MCIYESISGFGGQGNMAIYFGNRGTLPVTFKEQENISFKTYILGNIGKKIWTKYDIVFREQGNIDPTPPPPWTLFNVCYAP